jgi:ABC-type transporter MlaC component
VQTVTRDVFANACANKETLADNTRNARSVVSSSARRYFNFSRMASLTVGPNWETANAEQRKQLTDVFRAVLIHTWAESVIQYCDWTVEVDPPRANPGTQDVTVSTVMRRAGAQAITIDYLLEEVKNQDPKKQGLPKQIWRVIDITVNGQSIVESYRETFADKLRAIGMDGLIKWAREQVGTDLQALLALAMVVGFEALGVGLGTAAFVAFMARTTHPAYTATQLALFTSLMAVPRTLVNASAGWLVEGMGGWTPFFWFCFFLAIPGMLLLLKVAPWNGSQPFTPAMSKESERADDDKPG